MTVSSMARLQARRRGQHYRVPRGDGGDSGHLLPSERIVPQSEVIGAILLEDSLCCGVPHHHVPRCDGGKHPVRGASERCRHPPLTVVPCLRFGPRRTCWRRARPGPACFADHPDALPLGCALLSHVSQRTTCSMDISIGMETRRDTQSIHRIPAGVLLPSLPPAGVSTGMGRGCQQN